MDERNLKILILDDNESDVELIKLYASTVDGECTFYHVSTKPAFEDAVESFSPDLILTDYNLNGYDGVSALKFSLEHSPNTPIIMVTGSLGEELAAQIIKIGASDFLLKDNLSMLPKSIVRSLREAAEKAAKIDAQERLSKNYSELLELQIKLFGAQINPHFMFNSLSSFQYFLLDNRTDEALEYLSVFAKLIRKTLNNTRSSLITIADEIEFLDLYLTSEQNRLNGKFSFNISVNDDIDPESTYIPPMILQPYVENSIIHGVSALDEKEGVINVSFELADKESVLCIVEDNGVGRKESSLSRSNKSMKSDHHSMGTDITNARLKVFKEYFGKNFNQKTIDRHDEGEGLSGMRVEVMLPLDAE